MDHEQDPTSEGARPPRILPPIGSVWHGARGDLVVTDVIERRGLAGTSLTVVKVIDNCGRTRDWLLVDFLKVMKPGATG